MIAMAGGRGPVGTLSWRGPPGWLPTGRWCLIVGDLLFASLCEGKQQEMLMCLVWLCPL